MKQIRYFIAIIVLLILAWLLFGPRAATAPVPIPPTQNMVVDTGSSSNSANDYGMPDTGALP